MLSGKVMVRFSSLEMIELLLAGVSKVIFGAIINL